VVSEIRVAKLNSQSAVKMQSIPQGKMALDLELQFGSQMSIIFSTREELDNVKLEMSAFVEKTTWPLSFRVAADAHALVATASNLDVSQADGEKRVAHTMLLPDLDLRLKIIKSAWKSVLHSHNFEDTRLCLHAYSRLIGAVQGTIDFRPSIDLTPDF